MDDMSQKGFIFQDELRNLAVLKLFDGKMVLHWSVNITYFT